MLLVMGLMPLSGGLLGSESALCGDSGADVDIVGGIVRANGFRVNSVARGDINGSFAPSDGVKAALDMGREASISACSFFKRRCSPRFGDEIFGRSLRNCFDSTGRL